MQYQHHALEQMQMNLAFPWLHEFSQDIWCDSSYGELAGIATHYGMGGGSGDGIPDGARFSAPLQTGPGAHTASCKMGTASWR